ncbi:MAG: DUF2793 domain-containing protein [Nitrospinae bacterium]|nr:DUF2793 domain-containing protein [Nitrospinota bacterium]
MTTPNLAMDELSVSQGSKEITHNEALRVLDALVNSGVEDKDLTSPPGSPANGALYIVGAGATGAWATKDGKIAQYYSSAWYFHAPREGWIVYIKDEDLLYVYNGSAWASAPPIQRFILTFQYSGLAIDEETIIDGVRFQASATVTKIGIHAREAPAGAALTVDILQNSAEQSRVATLADGATKQITDITDINFSTAQDFGLRIKSVGSTAPGNELTVIIYGQYQ